MNCSTFNPQISFKFSKELVSRKNQDGTIVVMRMDDSDQFYKVDGLAAEIWKQLENGLTLGQAVEQVATAHNAPDEQLFADSETFLKKLIDLEMISLE